MSLLGLYASSTSLKRSNGGGQKVDGRLTWSRRDIFDNQTSTPHLAALNDVVAPCGDPKQSIKNLSH